MKTKRVIVAIIAVVSSLFTLVLLTYKGWHLETEHLDGRVRDLYVPQGELLTMDSKKVGMSVRIKWRISDLGAFAPKFSRNSIMAAQDHLKQTVARADANLIGIHNLSDLVGSDQAEPKLDGIEKAIQDSLQAELDKSNCGIGIESLVIDSVVER